ncbi:hypothetical protein [Thermosulfurimonas sp. F29]|uniref:hypothetical protein n=1 Tax=Thermosulfurimonas sp. F29 TaxID=2867247 RepID=UPI001C83A690|nr:hypothetical protein [Thermosulfurimonas sp. F29]MBX6423273.1 hypothetical protein [Thermosulfurimonas sp. F29]
MKRLVILSIIFVVLSGICFAGKIPALQHKINPKQIPPKPEVERLKPLRPPLLPDIKTELRWDLVRYVGQYSRRAIVRLTATFTNIGGDLQRCPDPPCKVVLRSLEPSSPRRVREVLAQQTFDSFRSGQRIVLTKEVEVYCAEEFSPIFEALHDVNFENPNSYFYHDPDYLRPRGYDSNYRNDTKEIDQDDIERALWDWGCRPTRR